MNEVFATTYSNTYDALYADKDYEAECDLLEELFSQFAGGPVNSVLDLGCGTGNHAVLLAQRGYQVTGVDRSPQMLRHARDKANNAGLGLELLEGDVRTVDAGGPFDAVLLMFAVLSYQTTNADVLATLRSVRRHLHDGGLTVFDVWYGPGVLRDVPDDRTKEAVMPDGLVTRAASAQLDTRRHLCRVQYELRTADGNPRFLGEETHTVRYFFPMELELFLDLAALQLLLMCPFQHLDLEPDEQTRNALVVARAR